MVSHTCEALHALHVLLLLIGLPIVVSVLLPLTAIANRAPFGAAWVMVCSVRGSLIFIGCLVKGTFSFLYMVLSELFMGI